MARIAIGGFEHETNTFAPSKATFEDFARPGAWPGLTRGPALLEAVSGINLPIAGFIEQARQAHHELLPLSWSQATPSAEVTEEAFERIVGQIIEDLRGLRHLDAVYLDLHGAMVAEHVEDGEGEILARVRRVVGPDLPLVASLDLHANITPAMVELSDALVVFRTYPHVDMAKTGRARGVADRPLPGGPGPVAQGLQAVALPDSDDLRLHLAGTGARALRPPRQPGARTPGQPLVRLRLRAGRHLSLWSLGRGLWDRRRGGGDCRPGARRSCPGPGSGLRAPGLDGRGGGGVRHPKGARNGPTFDPGRYPGQPRRRRQCGYRRAIGRTDTPKGRGHSPWAAL